MKDNPLAQEDGISVMGTSINEENQNKPSDPPDVGANARMELDEDKRMKDRGKDRIAGSRIDAESIAMQMD